MPAAGGSMTSAEAEWPAAETLRVPDLKNHLERHNIYFPPGTLRAGLVEIYDDNRPLLLCARPKAESDPPKRPRQIKTQPPNCWLASGRLNIKELKHILTEHQVTFGDVLDCKTLVPLYDKLKASRQTCSGTADILPNEGGSRTTTPVPTNNTQPIPDRPPPQPNLVPPPPPPVLVPPPDKGVPRATIVIPKAKDSSHNDPMTTGLPQLSIVAPPASKRPADEALIQDEESTQLNPSPHPQTHLDPSSNRSPECDPAAEVPMDPAFPSKRPRIDPTPKLPPPILPRVLPPLRLRPRWVVERNVPKPDSNPWPHNPLDLIDFSGLADLPRSPNNSLLPTDPVCTSNDHAPGGITSNLPPLSFTTTNGPLCTQNTLQDNTSDPQEPPHHKINNTAVTEPLCMPNHHERGGISSNLPPLSSTTTDGPLSTRKPLQDNTSDPQEPPHHTTNNKVVTQPLCTPNHHERGGINPNLPPQSSATTDNPLCTPNPLQGCSMINNPPRYTKNNTVLIEPLCQPNHPKSCGPNLNLPPQSSATTDHPPSAQNEDPPDRTLCNPTELTAQGFMKIEDPDDWSAFLVESSYGRDPPLHRLAQSQVMSPPLQSGVLIDLLDPDARHCRTNKNTTPTDSSLPSVCHDAMNHPNINTTPPPNDLPLPSMCTDVNTPKGATHGATATGSNHQHNNNSTNLTNDLLMHHPGRQPIKLSSTGLPTQSHSPVNSSEVNSVVEGGQNVAQELSVNSEAVLDFTKSITPPFTADATGSNHQQNDNSNNTMNDLALHHTDLNTIEPSLQASLPQPSHSAVKEVYLSVVEGQDVSQELPANLEGVLDATKSITPTSNAEATGANNQHNDKSNSTTDDCVMHHPERNIIKPSLQISLPPPSHSAVRPSLDVSVPASRVDKRHKTSSERSPSVKDLDCNWKRLKLIDTQKTTSAPRFKKPKRAKLVIITSSDEEDEEDETPLPSQTCHTQTYPASSTSSEPVPQPNLENQPDLENQPNVENQPGPENQPDPDNQPESAPVPKPTPQTSPPSPPKHPQQEWSATPRKLTIAKIKNVMVEFACKWRSSDKKDEFVIHYETLAKKQQEIWRVYLEATRVYLEATSKSKEPTKDALPAPSEPPNSCQPLLKPSQPGEVVVNRPVTRPRRKVQATSPSRRGSIEILEPVDPFDADSIAAVAEMPDLIDMSPRSHTEQPNQTTPTPFSNWEGKNRQLETPLPTRQLVEWARRIEEAVHEMDADEPPTHNNTPQNPAAPEASFMSAIRLIMGPLTDIATGVKSIGASLQATPVSSRPRTATRSRRPSRAVPSDQDTELPSEGDVQMDEGEADVHKIPIAQPEGGGCISTAIRLHCAALIRRVRGGPLPAPAPDVERARWINTFENQANAGASDTDSEDRTHADDMDLDTHPRLVPYHQNLTRGALQIMRRQLRLARVRSFRPDLGTAPSKPSNEFLWGLALKMFMIIVRAGEYPTVTETICNKAQAKKHLRTHVDTLMELWRKQTKMTPEAIAATEKRVWRNTRHGRLCEWRTDTILTIPAINQLVPIVAQCCSDDETDDELDKEGRESLAPGQKACVVLGMPWRNPCLTLIMQELDRIRSERLAANPCSSNPPMRQRRRLSNARQSGIKAPEQLPAQPG
ncbi:hypothetical protein Pst134EB_020157 [Puccinia striiformis f. sp. tritici]|nr:hypothetical protein Pst134EB_020157 [Puccinia striiformis f. sp. tritici]